MEKKSKQYAMYAVLILIVVALFAIEDNIALFIAIGALTFLGFVIETTKAKD